MCIRDRCVCARAHGQGRVCMGFLKVYKYSISLSATLILRLKPVSQVTFWINAKATTSSRCHRLLVLNVAPVDMYHVSAFHKA